MAETQNSDAKIYDGRKAQVWELVIQDLNIGNGVQTL